MNGKNTIFVILAIIAHDSRLSVRLVTDNECHKLTTTYEYVCVCMYRRKTLEKRQQSVKPLAARLSPAAAGDTLQQLPEEKTALLIPSSASAQKEILENHVVLFQNAW